MRIHWLIYLNFIGGPIGGLVGIGIDFLTGKMFTVSNSEVLLTLEPKNGEESAEEEISQKAESTEPNLQVSPPLNKGSDEVKVETLTPYEQPPPQDISSDQLQEIQSAFAPPEVEHQISLYYGKLTKKELEATKQRIYFFLLQMQKEGLEADIDEAVRRDQFR